ncbi:MAG: hypothetical protein KJ072_21150 [Verrucomicrobia bacterium]|nr:hypothetical protein [Verrucomicrobiota bacterium]
MGIKTFHLLFVALSLLLCLFVGGWGIAGWRSGGTVGQLWFGCGGLVAGVGMVAYGRYVFRKLRGMSYL